MQRERKKNVIDEKLTWFAAIYIKDLVKE